MVVMFSFVTFKKYATKNVEIIKLPSTSPANAQYSFKRLCEEWQVIRN